MMLLVIGIIFLIGLQIATMVTILTCQMPREPLFCLVVFISAFWTYFKNRAQCLGYKNIFFLTNCDMLHVIDSFYI